MGISQNSAYFFGEGPQNKDYSILGFILGSLYFGKLPNWVLKVPKNLQGYQNGTLSISQELLVFRVQWFGVYCLGFRGLGFRGLGFRV